MCLAEMCQVQHPGTAWLDALFLSASSGSLCLPSDDRPAPCSSLSTASGLWSSSLAAASEGGTPVGVTTYSSKACNATQNGLKTLTGACL